MCVIVLKTPRKSSTNNLCTCPSSFLDPPLHQTTPTRNKGDMYVLNLVVLNFLDKHFGNYIHIIHAYFVCT